MGKFSHKDVIYILVVVIVLFVAVYLFTRPAWLSCFDLTQTGTIGDTIGGITAPILNFIGAILVFYSFREQYEANKLQKDALNAEIKRIQGDKEFDRINSMLNQITSEISNLAFTTDEIYKKYIWRKVNEREELIDVEHNGFKTILVFAEKFEKLIGNSLGASAFLTEISSILKTFEFGLKKIHEYNYETKDKLFLYQRFMFLYNTKLKSVELVEVKLDEFNKKNEKHKDTNLIKALIEWHTEIKKSIESIKNLAIKINSE